MPRFLSRIVFCPAKMRNVAYTWRDSKEMREISLTGQKIHTGETIWSVKIVTRKNTRVRCPEDWKSSLKVGRRNFFSSSDFSHYTFWLGTLYRLPRGTILIVFTGHHEITSDKNRLFNNITFNVLFPIQWSEKYLSRKNLS